MDERREGSEEKSMDFYNKLGTSCFSYCAFHYVSIMFPGSGSWKKGQEGCPTSQRWHERKKGGGGDRGAELQQGAFAGTPPRS